MVVMRFLGPVDKGRDRQVIDFFDLLFLVFHLSSFLQSGIQCISQSDT